MDQFKKRGGFGGGDRRGGGNFNRNNKRPSFGGKPGFRRDQGNTEMFSTVCASCGKNCEVPFRPNGDKPVYCNDCFRNNKPDGGSNFNRRDDRRGDRRENTREFSAPQNDEVKKQLELLNTKLEKIIQLLSNRERAPLKSTIEDIASRSEKPAAASAKKTTKKKTASKKK